MSQSIMLVINQPIIRKTVVTAILFGVQGEVTHSQIRKLTPLSNIEILFQVMCNKQILEVTYGRWMIQIAHCT